MLGIFSLFPSLYETIISKLGIQSRSQRLLGKGTQNKNSIIGPVITGAALGPVFSSCSPVYAYIIATILPGSFAEAMAYIIAYVIGLAGISYLQWVSWDSSYIRYRGRQIRMAGLTHRCRNVYTCRLIGVYE